MEYRAQVSGNELHLSGYEQTGGYDTIITASDKYIVAKSKGHSYNPGSRNSGLLYYASPETTVYEVKGTDKFGRLILEKLISWENTRKGRKGRS